MQFAAKGKQSGLQWMGLRSGKVGDSGGDSAGGEAEESCMHAYGANEMRPILFWLGTCEYDSK